MSRSPTRTPPLRINAAFFSAIADLEDPMIGRVMRIAAHHVRTDRPMTIEQFSEIIGQDGLFLHAVLQGMNHLLDQDALASGDLVVSLIAEGLQHRAQIAAKRSDAANARYVRAAAEQKARGSEIKLTRGRVAGSRKGAAAARKANAPDPSVCTHVHNGADYAHMYTDDACTHVHNDAVDAHMCIGDESTHVHNRAVDAHMCIEDARDSDDEYAHMCITPAGDDAEMAENVDFSTLDRSSGSYHARARAPRADLSISNHSSGKNKRVESARVRGHARYEDAPMEPHGENDPLEAWLEGRDSHNPVAPTNHDQDASLTGYDEPAPGSSRGSRPSAGSAAAVPPEFLRRLGEAGPVDVEKARRQLADWIGQWGEPFVRSGIEAIPDKPIARPLSYLGSILKNLVAEAGIASRPSVGTRNAAGTPQERQEGPSGPSMPRRVKRRISMRPGAAWEAVGWTARGHEGDPGDRRRRVWRTESGDLRYLDAEAPDEIPTYEEDPGVYAYD